MPRSGRQMPRRSRRIASTTEMPRSGRQMPRRGSRIASTNDMFRSGRQTPKRSPRKATSSGSIPALEPLAPTLIKKPAGFLSLPRELRDQVYAYLLSTEYTRQGFVSRALNPSPLPRLMNFRYLGNVIMSIDFTPPSFTPTGKSAMKPVRLST